MKTIFFTAFDRPAYLRETLESWKRVRGTEDWHLYALIEPSRFIQETRELFFDLNASNPFKDIEILVNPQIYGPQHNPWVGMERLFHCSGNDFAVCTEDDHPVSDDILEYFTWADNTYRSDPSIGTVCAYSNTDGDPDKVSRRIGFSPWTWGTWRDRWYHTIGPTWDHDYSTFNGFPGNQSGFDWNLNTRVFPEKGISTIFPHASRSQNIGKFGAHAVPEFFEQSPSFTLHRNPVNFIEV